MRRLSERQARTCEQACGPRCRCRCGGVLHGAARKPTDAGKEWFEGLPEDDPHKVTSDEERQKRNQQRKTDRQRFKSVRDAGRMPGL